MRVLLPPLTISCHAVHHLSVAPIPLGGALPPSHTHMTLPNPFLQAKLLLFSSCTDVCVRPCTPPAQHQHRQSFLVYLPHAHAPFSRKPWVLPREGYHLSPLQLSCQMHPDRSQNQYCPLQCLVRKAVPAHCCLLGSRVAAPVTSAPNVKPSPSGSRFQLHFFSKVNTGHGLLLQSLGLFCSKLCQRPMTELRYSFLEGDALLYGASRQGQQCLPTAS